jgi:Spy/CpxP family protein refolding chaperone
MNPDSLQKARLWLAVVFLLGAAIGAVFGYTFGHRSYAATVTTPAAMSEPERRAKRVADMTREVGLTPEQSAKMDEIIRGAHQEMKGIREKAEQDVDGVREKARNEMRVFLTDEQKPKFEAMVQRMDADRKKQQQSGEVKK